MGRSFSSTQIYNSNRLKRGDFISFFTKEMEKTGYVPCESDQSEITYILRFSENTKWVTIASESYEHSNAFFQADTKRIAQALNTACIMSTVVDSDFATLDLFDGGGNKKDTLIMGRADDYFGDDIQKPSEKIWKPYLSKNSTWEQFNEILGGEYVFVEDGLAQLAPVIGMDSGNLLFSAEDAEYADELMIFLEFKRAGGKKQLTINSAFKKIMGEALEPYGFKVIKGRQPYIVRVINNEILHVISFYPCDPDYPYDKAIIIVCGIATVYRKRISFDKSPKKNKIWLNYIREFYTSITHETNWEITRNYIRSYYHSNDPESMIATLKTGAENLIKYVLPVFDEVKDIDSALDFAEDFGQPCYSRMCTEICNTYSDEDESFLNFLSEKVLSKQYRFLENYLNDSEFHKWVLNEIEKRKKENTDILKTLGIIDK